MHESQISLSVSNLMGQFLRGVGSIGKRRNHADRLAPEEDDGEVHAVRRIDDNPRLWLQVVFVAESDTELKRRRAEVGERDGSARDSIDKGRVVWETRLGGEVMSEDGVGRGQLHRRVGRGVNGHGVRCRDLKM